MRSNPHSCLGFVWVSIFGEMCLGECDQGISRLRDLWVLGLLPPEVISSFAYIVSSIRVFSSYLALSPGATFARACNRDSPCSSLPVLSSDSPHKLHASKYIYIYIYVYICIYICETDRSGYLHIYIYIYRSVHLIHLLSR